MFPKSATQLAAQFANKDAVLLLLEHGFVHISLNKLDWVEGGRPSPCRFCLSARMIFWDFIIESYSLSPNINIDGVKYILLSLFAP